MFQVREPNLTCDEWVCSTLVAAFQWAVAHIATGQHACLAIYQDEESEPRCIIDALDLVDPDHRQRLIVRRSISEDWSKETIIKRLIDKTPEYNFDDYGSLYALRRADLIAELVDGMTKDELAAVTV